MTGQAASSYLWYIFMLKVFYSEGIKNCYNLIIKKSLLWVSIIYLIIIFGSYFFNEQILSTCLIWVLIIYLIVIFGNYFFNKQYCLKWDINWNVNRIQKWDCKLR